MTKENPYAAPPEPVAPQRRPSPASGVDEPFRKLRIGCGVALIVVGVWSVFSGGCTAAAGVLGSIFEGDGGAFVGDSQGRKRGPRVGPDATGALVAGSLNLAAGFFCLVCGILLQLRRGATAALIGCGLGLVGQVLFTVAVGVHWAAVCTAVIYVGLVAALLKLRPHVRPAGTQTLDELRAEAQP